MVCMFCVVSLCSCVVEGWLLVYRFGWILLSGLFVVRVVSGR